MAGEAPADPEDFCVLVQAMVGPKGQPGEESFDFIVCTPAWLARAVGVRGFVFGHHHLVVRRYDAQLIEAAIRELCDDISGESWADVAAKLSRYGAWEFEDYREAPFQSGSG
jgi:hypothetical protein